MTEIGKPLPVNPESFPKIGGIPVDFAQIAMLPDHKVIVKAAISEDRVSIYADNDRVEIHDLDEPQVGLEVDFFDFPDSVEEDPEQITNRVSINVSTVIEKGGRRYKNPDFRAKELTQAALSYFETIHGPVNAIMFDFPGSRHYKSLKYGSVSHTDPSDNFVAYFSVKNAELTRLLAEGVPNDEAEERTMTEGAKASWSYRTFAVPRGLTRVRNVVEFGIDEDVEATVSGEFVRELNDPLLASRNEP
ncbi:MAG: hypothetical protein HZC02_00460 [Candidatus Levybacteria bacterium]|nr:hypothetical protein [Candidatus Levybacteria bacterium]